MTTRPKIVPEIEYAHQHPWATVKTLDGEHEVSVSLTNLLYDEEGNIYLLVHKHPFQELRLYIK